MTTTASRPQDPDGRPLYAYKWSDKDYHRIKEQVCIQMPRALRGTEAYRFSSMFCIFAAETFRRRHEGGPWSWDTIFAEIGCATPEYQLIYPWVEKGLRHFKRDLLKSHRGDRQFLITLACEGGLPLRLLHRQSAHLNRYFRELLALYHRERQAPECDVTEMARQVAARHLPGSLRHDVVFRLSGELIQSVVRLQERVAEAADPIASLDAAHSNWRDDLPLPVEDATVETLLRNLVGEAKTLAQTERQRWRWRCLLFRQGDSWTIEQRLELPNTVKGTSLQSWSDWDDLPARLHVLLQTGDEVDVIALLTRLQGMGEQAVYRCEGVRANGVRLLGNKAAVGARLWLSWANEKAELPMTGGQELGPLPWVFAERDGQWEWCGEGSVRRREASVRVMPLDTGGHLVGEGNYEPLGKAPDLQRSLYQTTGTVEWQHSELGTCQIQCASQEASEERFTLRGNRLSSVLNTMMPFLGMPSLFAIGRDEIQRRVAHGTLEWRPINAPEHAWRTEAATCAGNLWIRYRDASGTLRFRRQVEVVPSTTQIEMVRVSASPEEAGKIRLTGLSGARVIVQEVEDCQFQTRLIDQGVEIDCFVQSSVALIQFQANLQWPDGRSLTLQLPLPRQGAAFVCGGQALPSMERVALGRLAAIQAVVRTPSGGGRFRLEGRVKTKLPNPALDRLEVREWLHISGHESIPFALHRLQEQLASMLSLTGDLNAVVPLEIVDGQGHVLAQLEVAQFDVAPEPDRAQGQVILPPSSWTRFSDNKAENITLVMRPLWDPSATPIDLVHDNATRAWEVPQSLDPGPWWVLGYDGDWARFRPLLWSVEGEQTPIDASPLAQAILEPSDEVRQEKLELLVRVLATDTEHSDWPSVFDYLRLTRAYPASAFDLFRHLVKTPEAMVLALLKSTDDEFDLVWSLAEQLPFAWYLTPVSAWWQAADCHFRVLRQALGDSDPEGGLLQRLFWDFRERVTSRQPFFTSICDWIGEQIFPGQTLANSELAMARYDGSMFIELIQQQEQALQARHDADERYPAGPHVMKRANLPDFLRPLQYDRLSYPYRPVRYAPFVAAQMSLDEQDCPETLLFELRQLREFDAEWFDHAFAFALCLRLAQRPVVKEGTSL